MHGEIEYQVWYEDENRAWQRVSELGWRPYDTAPGRPQRLPISLLECGHRMRVLLDEPFDEERFKRLRHNIATNVSGRAKRYGIRVRTNTITIDGDKIVEVTRVE